MRPENSLWGTGGGVFCYHIGEIERILCSLKGMVFLDVREVLQRFDALLAEGRVSEAGAWLDTAAEECRKNGDYAAAVTVFNEIEGFWRAAGDRDRSFAAAESAIALLESAGLTGGVDYATTLLNYATAKSAFGYGEEALALFRRAEVIYDARLSENDYRFASLYNNMAQSLLRLRRASEAARYFNRSLALLEHTEDSEDEKATCCVNLSFCLMAEGRFDEARSHLDTAEKIFDVIPDSPHRSSMLAARGQLEYLTKNYAAAVKYYENAALSLEKRFGRRGSVYASSCRNCAKACEADGRTEEARIWRAAAESADIARGGR